MDEDKFQDSKQFETPGMPGGDFVVEQKESVKLIKNTKGYNWEIKIIGDPVFDEGAMKRLKELDDKLKKGYGKSE